jgi:hypothetical protein
MTMCLTPADGVWDVCCRLVVVMFSWSMHVWMCFGGVSMQRDECCSDSAKTLMVFAQSGLCLVVVSFFFRVLPTPLCLWSCHPPRSPPDAPHTTTVTDNQAFVLSGCLLSQGRVWRIVDLAPLPLLRLPSILLEYSACSMLHTQPHPQDTLSGSPHAKQHGPLWWPRRWRP